ncbi:uncharacterized protein LOC114348161 [Diabrotica virgifera virgifera]|uniref:Uncharacterized protein LOC114348161 n=1 Tax=Diabrotica virgifera virgifera TaxID=50390 RepID=A0A6P7HA96_DIAVI|nr:uncharacterized protein LOC114348161 [Diabrotica virgifera virgifera]
MNIFCFCLLACLVVVKAQTREQQLITKRAIEVHCQKTIRLTDEFVNEVGSGKESDPVKAGEFAYCVNFNIGIQNELGEVNVERVKQLFGFLEIKEDQIQEFLAKCTAKKELTKEQNGLSITQCSKKYI